MSRICRMVARATLALSIAIVVMPPWVHAAPRIIPYQGRLTDAAGTPLNGSFVIRYSIYTVLTGGSAAWSDTQTVSAANGLFSSTLGAGIALPSNLFSANPDLFLGIKVGTDPEMVPRQQLLPVPFAIHAEEAGVTQSLITRDHDFSVTLVVGPGDVRWVMVNRDGTILRQSGGITAAKLSGSGYYQVDIAGLNEAAMGISISSFNAPGHGTDPVVATGFANDATGLYVQLFAPVGPLVYSPDPTLRQANVGTSAK